MAKRKESKSIGAKFEAFSKAITQFTGSTAAFGIALGVVVVWALVGPLFGFSDTWQLVINTGTTIVTFLMVFLIQRSQNKDSLAIHLKLNELVAAMQGASNRLIDVESAVREGTGDAAPLLHASWPRWRARKRQVTESHSVEEARERHSAKLGTKRKSGASGAGTGE